MWRLRLWMSWVMLRCACLSKKIKKHCYHIIVVIIVIPSLTHSFYPSSSSPLSSSSFPHSFINSIHQSIIIIITTTTTIITNTTFIFIVIITTIIIIITINTIIIIIIDNNLPVGTTGASSMQPPVHAGSSPETRGRAASRPPWGPASPPLEGDHKTHSRPWTGPWHRSRWLECFRCGSRFSLSQWRLLGVFCCY